MSEQQALLTVTGWLSEVKVLAGWVPGDDPLLGLHLRMATFSPCPHTSKREGALVSLSLLTRTLIPRGCLTPRLPLLPTPSQRLRLRYHHICGEVLPGEVEGTEKCGPSVSLSCRVLCSLPDPTQVKAELEPHPDGGPRTFLFGIAVPTRHRLSCVVCRRVPRVTCG